MARDRPEVVVTDIKMPFWSMVVLMVKWAIAAIPALIIFFVIATAAGAAFSAIFGTGWYWQWGGGRGV